MTEVTGVTVDVEGAIRGFQRLSIGNLRTLEAWELSEGGLDGTLDMDPVTPPLPTGREILSPKDCFRTGDDDDGPPPLEVFDDDDALVVKLVSTFKDGPELDPVADESPWMGGVGRDPEDFLTCPPPRPTPCPLDPAAACPATAAREFFTASAIR